MVLALGEGAVGVGAFVQGGNPPLTGLMELHFGPLGHAPLRHTTLYTDPCTMDLTKNDREWVMSGSFKFGVSLYGALLAGLLSGCGGGGGGGESSISPPKTYILAAPSLLTAMPTVGTASYPTTVSDYGAGTVSFPAESYNDSVSYGVTASSPAISTGVVQLLPVMHLSDTNAATAWSSGWTGRGVSITVIDDFTSQSISVVPFLSVEVDRVKISGQGNYNGVYKVHYYVNRTATHGEVVANIVGGDFDGQAVSGPFVLKNATSSIVSCNATPSACTTKFYNSSLYYPNSTETVTYKKVAGVAKEALITESSVNLSAYQNATQTVAYIQGHLRNSILSAVVNMSLGYDIPTTGQTFEQVMEAVATQPLPSKLDSVIVVAAGNGGAPCATSDLAGCNALAVAMSYQDATKESTIVAGALQGSGSSENIATYSTRAGVLASRFLLASGETGFAGVYGTSFAAPRIAGAAAVVKQKYPALTAKQIADVLLLSANKDINNSGVPSFTGIHPVYGHGKLDLQRALSLAGAM